MATGPMATAGTGIGPDGRRFAAILLAAGAGRRFGGGKLLAPHGGGVLLDGALAAALAAPVETVILVTGAQADAVAAAAQATAQRLDGAGRLMVVHAPDHAEGMGASLRAGAARLEPGLAGAFIFLGDMPAVPHAIAQALAVALGQGAQAAAPWHEGRRGHPVLVGAGLFPALRAARGDEGLRHVLAGLGADLAQVATDRPGVLFDVDRPEDLIG